MRHLLTLLLLISAGVFYMIGFASGVVAAIAVGVGLEMWFWMRVVRFGRRRSGPVARS